MENQFENKRVVVTGAGKGIGRAICLHLAKLKSRVIAISRTQSDLDSLKEQDKSIEVYHADVTDWDVIEKLLVDIGPVDCLVNNAAVNTYGPILEVSKQDLDSCTDINYKAAFHVLQVVARQMIKHEIEGRIVNVSSVAGMKSVTNLSTYCCSKAALDMMTRCFALELAPNKIRVNGLNLTAVMSGMLLKLPQERIDRITSRIPYGQSLEEEDVIKSVMYLLSEDSSMVTGVNLAVDGGHLLTIA